MSRAKQASPGTRSGRLPEHGFVRLPTILAVFPVSRSTWWAGVRSGKYPPATKLGPSVTAWRVEAIRELIASYRAAPTEAAPPGTDSAGD